jgi:hypothetical protein
MLEPTNADCAPGWASISEVSASRYPRHAVARFLKRLLVAPPSQCHRAWHGSVRLLQRAAGVRMATDKRSHMFAADRFVTEMPFVEDSWPRA